LSRCRGEANRAAALLAQRYPLDMPDAGLLPKFAPDGGVRPEDAEMYAIAYSLTDKTIWGRT
jgi:hypothetical protein